MSTASDWGLEAPHERFTKSDVKRGDTEHINCRISSHHKRRIDEILAGRFEPAFKTLTDVVQDSLVMWLEDWDSRHPDGQAGELAATSQIQLNIRRREARETFMSDVDKEWEALLDDADIEGIKRLLVILIKARAEFPPDSPPKFREKIDRMIERARRLTSDDK